jgi:hypothetical protein
VKEERESVVWDRFIRFFDLSRCLAEVVNEYLFVIFLPASMVF